MATADCSPIFPKDSTVLRLTSAFSSCNNEVRSAVVCSREGVGSVLTQPSSKKTTVNNTETGAGRMREMIWSKEERGKVRPVSVVLPEQRGVLSPPRWTAEFPSVLRPFRLESFAFQGRPNSGHQRRLA